MKIPILLQNATIVVQSFSPEIRDENMAANVGWLREHRSRSGRIIVWAHKEHIGETPTQWVRDLPMGWHLTTRFGADYVSIGWLTGSGTMLQWRAPLGVPVISVVPDLDDAAYEKFFRIREAPALLIPLQGPLPSWLSEPAQYFSAGTFPTPTISRDSLPAKFDAVVYINQTTAARPLMY